MRLTIKTYPRLHLTLIDMGESGYRRNGGLGFTVKDFSQSLTLCSTQTFRLNTLRDVGYSEKEIALITDRLIKIKKDYEMIYSIDLEQIVSVHRHVGFGSGTAIVLALVEGLAIINGVQLNQDTLQRLSGRGGTSGIGVNSYFTGGMILDGGRPFDYEKAMSSDDIAQPSTLPIVLQQIAMPQWPCGILILDGISPLNLDQERMFFDSTAPIKSQSVHEVTYHAIFGVWSSIATKDYEQFCNAVNAIQHCEWKSAEIDQYGDAISNAITNLRTLGCDAVGMSSLGPALFYFSQDIDATTTKVREAYPRATIRTTTPWNVGREVIYD